MRELTNFFRLAGRSAENGEHSVHTARHEEQLGFQSDFATVCW